MNNKFRFDGSMQIRAIKVSVFFSILFFLTYTCFLTRVYLLLLIVINNRVEEMPETAEQEDELTDPGETSITRIKLTYEMIPVF